MPTPNLLPGTLDVLVLKAISLGDEHGYGLLQRIQRMSREALVIEQGALYRRSSGSSVKA
jgi:DNA-binding PadR family transcriptional regulator